MILVVIFNVIILIILFATNNENVFKAMDTIDTVLIAVFVGEIVLKFIGFGIRNYFMEDLNKLEFVIVAFSLISMAAWSHGRVPAETQRAARIDQTVRFILLIRCLGLLKYCPKKSFKALNGVKKLVLPVWDIIDRVRKFFQKIITVLPTVIKLFLVAVANMYIYGIVGMEMYNSQFEIPGSRPTIYMSEPYVGFDEITEAYLSFMQFVTDQTWSDIINDKAVRFELSFVSIAIYFDTFYSINKFILLSMINGMVWEVFTVIDKNIQETEKLGKYLEEFRKRPVEQSVVEVEPASSPEGLIEAAKNFVMDELASKLVSRKKRQRRLSVDSQSITNTVLSNMFTFQKKGPKLSVAHLRSPSGVGLLRSQDK